MQRVQQRPLGHCIAVIQTSFTLSYETSIELRSSLDRLELNLNRKSQFCVKFGNRYQIVACHGPCLLSSLSVFPLSRVVLYLNINVIFGSFGRFVSVRLSVCGTCQMSNVLLHLPD